MSALWKRSSRERFRAAASSLQVQAYRSALVKTPTFCAKGEQELADSVTPATTAKRPFKSMHTPHYLLHVVSRSSGDSPFDQTS